MLRLVKVTLFIIPIFVFLLTNQANANGNDISILGQINYKKIPEASGIAVSKRQKQVFWLINDGGHSESVYAINQQGKSIGQFKLKGVENTDWEDIASFEYEGTPYLMIADIGDNKARRKHYTLYFVKEPKVKKLDSEKTLRLKAKWQLKFTYEDGAKDSEAAAVDIANNRVLLLSKRDKPPAFYELPLQTKPKKQTAIARKIGELQSLPTSLTDRLHAKYIKHGASPTAMDISADGLTGVILNYVKAYHFKSSSSSQFLFDAKPSVFNLPDLKQAEAVCFDAKGNMIITSEKLPAPLVKIKAP